MLSIPIKVTVQEVKDFPLDTLQINSQWGDIIDPQYDMKYYRKHTRKKKIQDAEYNSDRRYTFRNKK